MVRKVVVIAWLTMALAMSAAFGQAQRGYLGVAFVPIPDPASSPVRGGVSIASVLPGSAAEAAGLKAGQILVRIDGVFVGDPKTAVDVVSAHKAGDRLTLTVIDLTGGGFQQRYVVATLASSLPEGYGAPPRTPPPPAPTPQPGLLPPPGMASRGPMPTRGDTQPTDLGTPVPLMPLRVGACQAMAPAGWQVVDANREGSVFGVASPDGSLRAAYGIVGVGSGQVAGYYGPQYRTPGTFGQFLTGYLFGSQAYSKPPQPLPYGFQLLTWGTPNGFSGYSVLKTYPLPPDPGGYILSYYIGGGPASEVTRLVPLAVMVATSIRCTTQLRPPPPNDFHPARGARCFGGECREGDAAGSSLNSILGTEYVHDAAGNNFYVGSENWIENGKDGPGYYKRNGNDVTKSQPGLE